APRHQHDHDCKNCDNCESCDNYHVHYSENKIWSFVRSIGEEFFEMMSALVLGAALAGIVQSFIPRDLILAIGQNSFTSILAMMLFAVVISVCSSVDAFIALSYAGTFTSGSLLAFLVFGPMIDLKAIWMLKTTFRWKAVIYIVVLAFLMTLLLTTFYNFYLS
ncbi:permease, partial [Candidatus Peregrinibacteria bacterium]|nr:permease [Candidatus Peregrinibacteria bacterium]